MTRRTVNHFVLPALCGLLALAGCRDPEKEQALADLDATQMALAGANSELAAANSELAATQTTLDAIQKERHALRQQVQELQGQNETQRGRIDELTAEVAAAKLQADQLRKQLSAAEEKAAVEAETLKAQVAALEQDTARKDALIKSMQEKMAEMQKKIESTAKPPAAPQP